MTQASRQALPAEAFQATPESKPNPDPTVATNNAVERAVRAERDYVNGQLEVLRERMHGIDRATELRVEAINALSARIEGGSSHLTALIESQITRLEDLTSERFGSVQTQFRERDTRQERESRDNKVAVDAAFAAQKEAAAKQDEANAKAIDKSEKSTAETIKTNQELSKSTTDALTKSLDEVKLQVASIESVKRGGREQTAAIYALVAFIVSLLVLGGILASAGVFSNA